MYKYFANQLQIWSANGQNCVAFCYAMLNKFFSGCLLAKLTSEWFVGWTSTGVGELEYMIAIFVLYITNSNTILW